MSLSVASSVGYAPAALTHPWASRFPKFQAPHPYEDVFVGAPPEVGGGAAGRGLLGGGAGGRSTIRDVVGFSAESPIIRDWEEKGGVLAIGVGPLYRFDAGGAPLGAGRGLLAGGGGGRTVT